MSANSIAMDSASCPLLYTIRSCAVTHPSATPKSYNAGNPSCRLYAKPFCANSLLLSLSNCCCFGLQLNKGFSSRRFIPTASSRNDTDVSPSHKFALLLEVEGVLMDVYRVGNRHAFNAAFRKLGLDCANWAQPVYLDLVRKSAGDEERMLILFFNRIGWPTSLATSEKDTFLKSVLREKKNALDDLVMSADFNLRPGAEEFIDDACEEGIPVVVLTAYSTSGEKVARSIVEKLGTDRMSKIKVVGDEEVKQSSYGQLVFGEGVSSSLDEQLAKEVSKAASAERQRIAEEVASMLKLKVELNTSSSESLQYILAALRAGAEYANVPVHNCILVAGSQAGVAAAERISMPCVFLRSSSTSRAEFGSGVAVMDGFGGADLSISRLSRKFM